MPAAHLPTPEMLPAIRFPEPGVVLTPEGAAFTVYAARADAVDLCLYHPKRPEREQARVRLERAEGGFFHAHLRGVPEGTLYGYRVHGPWEPERGLRYNARKLLLDPYARAVVGDCRGRLDMLTLPGPRRPPGSTDNGATALKSVIVRGDFDWAGDAPPRTPWEDTVIYELHVKGFTKLHPGVPENLRGTYAGLTRPEIITYLKDLGVTAVQLLPVHQHLDDGFLADKGLTNYWGYNTIGFFAPHAEYAAAREPEVMLREFKEMVKAFHAAGIEVILDVVYNHTAEGDENGPSLLFRGFDNLSYYRFLEKEGTLYYHNMTGCGNSVASHNTPTLRLILDSLRYWVEEMHVDGFRFDLAVTVGRGATGYDRDSAFFTAVAQDPVLARVKLIAEPWDVGEMDSYQIGNFPAPWRELNGRFRDKTRRYWRGDAGSTAIFAKRFCGSEDIFGWDWRPPTASVNFITSHDGFTLRDLVSYHHKRNEANGEENRDGDSDNHSTNGGAEGETGDAEVLARRERLACSLLASLLCAQGVPFLTAGDERWRTQQGNNNAYCQDNEISWVDWSADTVAERMTVFTRRLLAFRRELPVLRRAHFFDGHVRPETGLRDVTWLDGSGGLLDHDEWHEPDRERFGMLLDGPEILLLLFNRGGAAHAFVLPGEECALWQRVFDTALEEPFPSGPAGKVGGEYLLECHTVACLRLVSGSCLPLIPA